MSHESGRSCLCAQRECSGLALNSVLQAASAQKAKKQIADARAEKSAAESKVQELELEVNRLTQVLPCVLCVRACQRLCVCVCVDHMCFWPPGHIYTDSVVGDIGSVCRAVWHSGLLFVMFSAWVCWQENDRLKKEAINHAELLKAVQQTIVSSFEVRSKLSGLA